MWKRILTPERLTEILENYAQIVEEVNPKTGKKKQVQIFPRYHQLDVVRQLIADVLKHGAGNIEAALIVAVDFSPLFGFPRYSTGNIEAAPHGRTD